MHVLQPAAPRRAPTRSWFPWRTQQHSTAQSFCEQPHLWTAAVAISSVQVQDSIQIFGIPHQHQEHYLDRLSSCFFTASYYFASHLSFFSLEILNVPEILIPLRRGSFLCCWPRSAPALPLPEAADHVVLYFVVHNSVSAPNLWTRHGSGNNGF